MEKRKDGSRYTSDESPGRSREVVNPHTWPVWAKIAEIRRGERQPTKNGTFGAERQPTQTDTGGRRRASAKPAGSDEGDTTVLDGSESARPTAVVFCGGLRQAREKISISVGAALAVLEDVVGRGEELKPMLDSCVVVPYLAGALKCFVVRKYAKLRPP